MQVTFDLKEALIMAVLFLAVIFLIIGIILLIKLIKTLKNANEIIEDGEYIVKLAKDRTNQVNNAINDTLSFVSGITRSARGKSSIIDKVSNISTGVQVAKDMTDKKRADLKTNSFEKRSMDRVARRKERQIK